MVFIPLFSNTAFYRIGSIEAAIFSVHLQLKLFSVLNA